MKPTLFAEEMPKGKFVGFYNDGSGAVMGIIHDHGWMDAEGTEMTEENFNDLLNWLPLPDDQIMWFEHNYD